MKSKDSPITHITVLGSYLTLWTPIFYGLMETFYKTHPDYPLKVDAIRFREREEHPFFHDGLERDSDHLHIFFKQGITEKSFNQLIDIIYKNNSSFTTAEDLANNRDKKVFKPGEAEKLKKQFKKYLMELENHKKTIHQQSPWYKRLFYSISLPAMLIALRVGVSFILASAIGFLSLAVTYVVNSVRDKFKSESYDFVKDHHHRWNEQEKNSFEVGVKSANSSSEQFLSLFNMDAWKYQQAYYAGLTAKQMNDEALINDVKSPMKLKLT